MKLGWTCKSTFNFRWEWAGCLRIAHGSVFTSGMRLIRTQFVCGFSLSSSSLPDLSLLFFFFPPQPSHMKICPLLTHTRTYTHTHKRLFFSATRGLRVLDEAPGRRHLQYATCIKVCIRCTIGPKMTAFYTSTHHHAFLWIHTSPVVSCARLLFTLSTSRQKLCCTGLVRTEVEMVPVLKWVRVVKSSGYS